MAFLDKIDKHFLWDAILKVLPSNARRSATGFININCPLCTTRGETADRRKRCGLQKIGDGILIHCFNCGAVIKWIFPQVLSTKMRVFLAHLGMPDEQINTLNYRLGQLRQFFSSDSGSTVASIYYPQFLPCALPDDAQPFSYWLDHPVSEFVPIAEYVLNRGKNIWDSTTFYWSPDHDLARRVIIPFYWQDQIVGWTGRSIDDTEPKYHNHGQPNYLFNNRFLYGSRQYVIIVEGIFDALAIDGIGTQGAKLNDQQGQWIESSNKIKVVVPDRDESGFRLVEAAIKHKWSVSFPDWDHDLKDVADAVKRYGRLYTLRGILEHKVKDPRQMKILGELYCRK